MKNLIRSITKSFKAYRGNNIYLYLEVKIYTLLILSLSISSCDGQKKTDTLEDKTSRGFTILSASEIQNDTFCCGLLASNGTLWFGTNNNGLYRYDGEFFTHYAERDGLCNKDINTIIEDAEGNILLGTPDGICKFDPSSSNKSDSVRFTNIHLPFQSISSSWLDKVYPTVNPNEVHTLLQDSKGNIWVGTGGAGVYRYNPTSTSIKGDELFTQYLSDHGRKQEDSLYHNWVPTIEEDDEGNIWFGSMTHGGVSRYDGKNFTHYMIEDGLSDDMLRCIYKDKAGKLWFGFNGNRNSALTSYNGESFSIYTHEDGLCSLRTHGICEDKNGHLWLGDPMNGLCIFDGENFKEFTNDKGNSLAGILFVLEDAEGHIWFGGKFRKLYRYDGTELTDFTNR